MIELIVALGGAIVTLLGALFVSNRRTARARRDAEVAQRTIKTERKAREVGDTARRRVQEVREGVEDELQEQEDRPSGDRPSGEFRRH